MRIGILGSGLMGGKLGTIFARSGHDVVFSYSHSQRKLTRLAREARGHAQAGTPREAALNADAVLLAVHWSRVSDVLQQTGDLAGKVIISCSLPMNASDTALAVAHKSSGAEMLARKVRKADVVSAFSTVPSEVLRVAVLLSERHRIRFQNGDSAESVRRRGALISSSRFESSSQSTR